MFPDRQVKHGFNIHGRVVDVKVFFLFLQFAKNQL